MYWFIQLFQTEPSLFPLPPSQFSSQENLTNNKKTENNNNKSNQTTKPKKSKKTEKKQSKQTIFFSGLISCFVLHRLQHQMSASYEKVQNLFHASIVTS